MTKHDNSKRYKAKLVVKWFQQKRGNDYFEVSSPVVKITTIRLVLEIVAIVTLHLEWLNVKINFLHGDLEEDIYYMNQRNSQYKKMRISLQTKKELVSLEMSLKIVVYKVWQLHVKFHLYPMLGRFLCYAFWQFYIILLLYVNDLLIVAFGIEDIDDLKIYFVMKDLGGAKQSKSLGKVKDTLRLSRVKYVKRVIRRLNINKVNQRAHLWEIISNLARISYRRQRRSMIIWVINHMP